MDSAYDAPEIKAKSLGLRIPAACRAAKKRLPPRRWPGATAGYALAEEVRYNERSAAERINGGIKDNFGARYVRVRGHAKVFRHLMFGILALTMSRSAGGSSKATCRGVRDPIYVGFTCLVDRRFDPRKAWLAPY
jgi:hypothetical protein